MQIPFNLYGLANQTSMSENGLVRKALLDCLARLRENTVASLNRNKQYPEVYVFNLPKVFNPSSSKINNAYALNALLDCMVELNLIYLRYYSVPDLYQSGVVYERTTLWEPIPALYKRQYGDCKSLGTALTAEYIKKGIQARPVFRWIENKNKVNDFHILTQTEFGPEDPSKRLGMGQDENVWFNPRIR